MTWLRASTRVVGVMLLVVSLNSCRASSERKSKTDTVLPSSTQQLTERERLELKLRCAEAGRQFHADLERKVRGTGQLVTQPRYGFNEPLNTCLCRYGVMKNDISIFSIIDLATGETLASYSAGFLEDPVRERQNRAEFERREKELFGAPGASRLSLPSAAP